MNERIKGLYQTHILQKSKDETRVGKLSSVTHTLEAYNPMCGDQFTLYLQVDQEKVIDARFEGYGCAISKASTAVLTDFVIGRSIDGIKVQIKEFFELIDAEANRAPEEIFQDDQLLAFAAAREFPERKTCASLSWEAFDEEFK
jgi:nitrogen fixation NifU-like protein